MPLITKAKARQMGIMNPSLQTIEIPKSWSLTQSRNWLKEHGFLWQYHRNTTNFRLYHRNSFESIAAGPELC